MPTKDPRFHVPGREVGYVLDKYEMQRDPLGIAETGDPGQDIHIVVRRAIEGMDEATTQKLVDALRQRNLDTVAGLDQLTARLMAYRGVDPLVMTWLSAISAEIASTEDDDCVTVTTVDLTVPHDDGSTVTRVDLGGHTLWMSPGLIELSALVTHPVLDAHPFVIRDIVLRHEKAQREAAKRAA